MQTRVQYPESIEPLVQFIEETPRDQILDRTLEKLRGGLSIEMLLTASALAAVSVGRNAPNFSARYIRIAPDSNTRMGFGPLRSCKTGILEFGFTETKPLPN